METMEFKLSPDIYDRIGPLAAAMHLTPDAYLWRKLGVLPDGSIKSHHGVNRETGKNIEELLKCHEVFQLPLPASLQAFLQIGSLPLGSFLFLPLGSLPLGSRFFFK